MSKEPSKPNEAPPREKTAVIKIVRAGLVGGAVGFILASFVSWAPRIWMIGDRDVSNLVGIAWFTFFWSTLGASVEIIPMLTERIFDRKK